jgi:hypothetical protein
VGIFVEVDAAGDKSDGLGRGVIIPIVEVSVLVEKEDWVLAKTKRGGSEVNSGGIFEVEIYVSDSPSW